jgi:cephalosporin hydroxylase
MADDRQWLRVALTALRDGPQPLLLARHAIREFGAIQRTWELQALLGVVRGLRPDVIVEIGTHRGGTLVCWSAVATPSAHIVSIDMPTDEWTPLGAREGDLARVRSRLQPGQRLTTIAGDSHASSTFARLSEALSGAPVDLLWIDGDHSLAGVRQDFEMYGALMRRGGVIALHDVHPSDKWPGFGTPAFWEEIKGRYHAEEFVAERQPGGGMGIGVIHV